jgi:putative transposase
MQFEQHKIYHIYNRGSHKQAIFFNEEHYSFFIRKIKRHILPNCELLAYCLMPDHFHLLIYANEQTVDLDERGRNRFSEAMRKLLSQYRRAINKVRGRTTSLFQENTIASEMAGEEAALHCFICVHKDPLLRPGTDLSKWRYSSFPDYAGFREETMCNKALACSLLGMSEHEFSLLMEVVQGNHPAGMPA